MFRAVVRKIAGPKILGMRDYYLWPALRAGFNGPFNGQEFRKRIFKDILAITAPVAIVETGTFRGTTTEYMAQVSALPIHTVELDPRLYGFAKARFLWNSRVRCACGDSRPFLRRVMSHSGQAAKSVFVYLDAHWNDDLPLKEEIEIIFGLCKRSVVMIDDFQVPNDEGYAYDKYSHRQCLDLNYLDRIQSIPLQLFFPACPSAQETGARRGCAVLAAREGLGPALGGAQTLVEWKVASGGGGCVLAS